MQKHVYEELPEVLFQEEALLRSIRQEFTAIIHDMKLAGHFDSLETVGDYALSDAVKALIVKHTLVISKEGDLNKLKAALEDVPRYIGPFSTLEEVIDAAVRCISVFSLILRAFSDKMNQITREEVNLAFSDEA